MAAHRYILRAFPALLLLALGGCVWLMDVVPTRELTFQGTVHRADGTPVEGAQVAVWLDPPGETATTPPPFGVVITNAAGEFRLRDELRSDGSPQEVWLRIVPPMGSGLASLALDGSVSQAFTTIEGDGRRVRYEGEFVLQPLAP